MSPAHVKAAWITWQQAHPDDAKHIHDRFATKAILHGFPKAERYLITAMMERLQLSQKDIQQALA